MSKYDNAFTLIVAYEGASQTSSYRVNGDQLEAAVSDIDARLAKLEAEAQKPVGLSPGEKQAAAVNRIPGSTTLTDVQAVWAAAERARTEASAPTQPQREPGWYPVWSKRTGHPQTYWFDGTQWRERPGHIGLVDLPSRYEDGFTIGPRIQPPEGAV